ncbi:hypothetical protein SAMN05216167_11915 [Spirosoma endophyticum]|uniref:Uncharacterized protein n=1 Tax=Spirosoma endophyticum TaxID=662367 RepID=A0A1I2D5F5_9BACT|nr:hypothetical protein SAMN05216167_11915 [Spirosoma endophyticum]
MIDDLLNLIEKGKVNSYTPEELAMHTRFTHYYAIGIVVCLALLIIQSWMDSDRQRF